jgi:hypothetical protein
MALRDLFIAIPNAIGAALNIVCLVSCAPPGGRGKGRAGE